MWRHKFCDVRTFFYIKVQDLFHSSFEISKGEVNIYLFLLSLPFSLSLSVSLSLSLLRSLYLLLWFFPNVDAIIDVRSYRSMENARCYDQNEREREREREREWLPKHYTGLVYCYFCGKIVNKVIFFSYRVVVRSICITLARLNINNY